MRGKSVIRNLKTRLNYSNSNIVILSLKNDKNFFCSIELFVPAVKRDANFFCW